MLFGLLFPYFLQNEVERVGTPTLAERLTVKLAPERLSPSISGWVSG